MPRIVAGFQKGKVGSHIGLAESEWAAHWHTGRQKVRALAPAQDFLLSCPHTRSRHMGACRDSLPHTCVSTLPWAASAPRGRNEIFGSDHSSLLFAWRSGFPQQWLRASSGSCRKSSSIRLSLFECKIFERESGIKNTCRRGRCLQKQLGQERSITPLFQYHAGICAAKAERIAHGIFAFMLYRAIWTNNQGSHSGSGNSRLIVPGRMQSRRARAVKTVSMPPAAPKQVPGHGFGGRNPRSFGMIAKSHLDCLCFRKVIEVG